MRASVSGFLGDASGVAGCRVVGWVVVGRRCGVALRLLLGAVSLCVTVAVGEGSFAFVGFGVRGGVDVLWRIPS